MKQVSGGVCAPKGFTAAGVHCGVRKNRTKRDLALIVSEEPCAAAAVYTQNLVKGAPLIVTRTHLENGFAQAIVCNSGNANTCNADGEQVAARMCEAVARETGLDPADVVVASTGVIGQPLDPAPIEAAMPALVAALSRDGSGDAAEAIMTTDVAKKEVAVAFEAGGRICTLGGVAKGSGMIHPNMATMLVFLTTDAAISPDMLRLALANDVKDSFNMISIDGDTSTNDMVAILANGLAGNPVIDAPGSDYAAFAEALACVTRRLCRAIAKDGEGAGRLLTCRVSGARSAADARTIAKAVICSSLVKTAMAGADANWGRVLCAVGYCGAAVDVNGVAVRFSSAAGTVAVCENGHGVPFSEETAKAVLSADEIDILLDLADGDACAEAWGCDLTCEYVKINSDYRT
jgi:glutamate N-acetyltransferase/amino-acid N-acetyltransferase